MKKFGRIIAVACAGVLSLSLLFTGCQDDTDEKPKASVYQTVDYQEGEYITVEKDTTNLVINNVKGKTLYMARINPEDANLEGDNMRAVENLSNSTESAGSTEPAENTGASINGSRSLESHSLEDYEYAASFLEALDKEFENDPHKKIYDYFVRELKKIREAGSGITTRGAESRTEEPAPDYPIDYKLGDTETFFALDFESFDKEVEVCKPYTYELLISEDDYNIWIRTDDSYYKKYGTAFKEAAETLGKFFINGYGLVKHLYGEPTDKLYDEESFEPITDMKTHSKTGTKINILLSEMLEIGRAYGYASPNDMFYNHSESNKGRFLYMDSKTLIEEPFECYSTSLHEFSHYISAGIKWFGLKKEWTYWYGELLAMLCEDMMQEYLGIEDSDIDNLIYTPKGRIANGNYCSWCYGLTGQSASTYSVAFMLGAWLSRNFGGAKFIKELATNPYVDMESIINAVNAMGGKQYTVVSLFQKYAEDMFYPQEGKGLNQNAATYSGNSEYTCSYTDLMGTSKTYLYPITPINLWDKFYGWCDLSPNQALEKLIVNESISFDDLPKVNTFKKHDWKDQPIPKTAILGPLVFNDGRILYKQIGPYAAMLFNLGKAETDSVELKVTCKGKPKDVLTIYVR